MEFKVCILLKHIHFFFCLLCSTVKLLSNSERPISRYRFKHFSGTVWIHNPVEVGALLFYTYTYCIYIASYFTHFVRLLLFPPWQFGGHRCSELSGRLTQTAVLLPKLATPFSFLAKSINQAWSGESACACTVKSPYRALFSTEMNLCQAPPWHTSHRKQTAKANGAPHEPICHTYAIYTFRNGSPLHRVTEGKGQLPVSP